MCGSLFSRYTVVNGFMNDEPDNSTIPSSICSICFLTPALAEYDAVLEWPIIGVVSVVLNFNSYTLHFPGLVVKNSVYLSSTQAVFLLLFNL